MILDAMSEALVRGDRIEIRGFGSFALYRPPRLGRNPKSERRSMCRRSGFPTSKRVRNCANGSIKRFELLCLTCIALNPGRSGNDKFRAMVTAPFLAQIILMTAIIWILRFVVFAVLILLPFRTPSWLT